MTDDEFIVEELLFADCSRARTLPVVIESRRRRFR
jgi:hypothetical protein